VLGVVAIPPAESGLHDFEWWRERRLTSPDAVATVRLVQFTIPLPQVTEVFFADSRFGPLDGDVVVAGKGLDRALVVMGTTAEHIFIDDREAEDVVEEVDHLLGSGKTAEVAMDDDAVKAVVYQNEQAVEQLGE
jgi:hypothetical protein